MNQGKGNCLPYPFGFEGRGVIGSPITGLWKSIFIVIAAGIILFLIPNDVLSSQSLNLSGLVALDYHTNITVSDAADQKSTSKTSDFLQTYAISSTGIIVDPRLASYSASIGIANSVYRNNPAEGESTKVSRDIVTYSLQLNIMPVRFPINVFAQRNLIGIENAPDLISDTYNIGWSGILRSQTALRLTLMQISTNYEDNIEPRDTRVRIANFGLTQPLRSGFLAANFQYTDYFTMTTQIKTAQQIENDEKNNINCTDKTQIGPIEENKIRCKNETHSKVNSYSLRGENRISPFLFLSGNVTYFPTGSYYTPGITTTAETTGDIGLLNQADRFTQSGNYSFRKTSGGDIQRDSLLYNVSYRPLGKTDYRGDAVYSSTSGQQTETKDYRLAGGVSHRPFYGLSISDNIVLHHFNVSGIDDKSIDRIGNIVGINYFKLLDVVTLNTNYSADYSTVFSDEKNSDGNIFTQAASVGVQSRTLQAVQIIASYTILIRSNTIVESDDRQEQSVRVEAQTNYKNQFHFRASSSYSDVLDYGDTFIFDTRAEYFYRFGTRFAGEYKLSNYPGSSNTQDSQLYIIEGNHFQNITWRLGMNLTLRGEREDFTFTNRDRLIMTARFNYQIGKVTLNFEVREDYTKYPESVYNIQTYFVRASRPF